MRFLGPLIAAVALLAAPRAVFAADDGAPGGTSPAVSATAVRAIATEYGFEGVAPSPDHPGRYALRFVAERPTPGYKVEVVSVRSDPSAATVVARIVEVPPEGMVAQVITRSPFSIDLPPLSAGTYAFRLERRREGAAAFAPAVTMTLTVR